MVIKTSEKTPLSALFFASLVKEVTLHEKWNSGIAQLTQSALYRLAFLLAWSIFCLGSVLLQVTSP